jgi:hypothetical protein
MLGQVCALPVPPQSNCLGTRQEACSLDGMIARPEAASGAGVCCPHPEVHELTDRVGAVAGVRDGPSGWPSRGVCAQYSVPYVRIAVLTFWAGSWVGLFLLAERRPESSGDASAFLLTLRGGLFCICRTGVTYCRIQLSSASSLFILVCPAVELSRVSSSPRFVNDY